LGWVLSVCVGVGYGAGEQCDVAINGKTCTYVYVYVVTHACLHVAVSVRPFHQSYVCMLCVMRWQVDGLFHSACGG